MRKSFLTYIPCLLLSALLLTVASPHALAADDNHSGTVAEVTLGDIMVNNYGTVTNNYGTVINNYGYVTNNYGTVRNNAISVTSNFGTIIDGNPADNQYYQVTCTGAENVTVTGGKEYNGAYYACAANALVFTANPGYKIDGITTTATKNADWNYNISTAESADFTLTVSRTTQDVTVNAILDEPYPVESIYARIMAASGGAAAAVTADATGAAIGDANGVFALEPAGSFQKTFSLFTHATDSAAITYTMQEGLLSPSGEFTPVAEGGVIKLKYESNVEKNYIVTYTGTTASHNRCTVVTFDRDGGTGGTESFTPVNNAICPSITPPTKDGYVFQGYYDANDDIQVFYAGGDPLVSATRYIDNEAKWIYTSASEVTFKAKWAELAATVTTSGGATTQYTTFIEAWERAKTLDDSTLMLFKDVTAGNNAPNAWPISVPSTAVFTLDLNGKTIDRGQTAAVDDGGVIKVEGDLTLTDTLGGGRITGGNTTGNGGGVCVSSGVNVSLLGGSITGNKAGGKGGGVYLPSGATIGGALSVTGNTSADNASNLYIDGGAAIQVAPAPTGSIGVSAGTQPTAGSPVAISTATAADYSPHFSADVPEQNVFTEAGVLKLRTAPTTAITFDKQSGTGGSASCTAVLGRALGEIAAYPAPSMPSLTNYTFAGYYSAATGGVQVIGNTGALAPSAAGYTDANAHWASEETTLTLYAHWAPAEYSIVYKDHGGADFTGTLAANTPDKHTYGTATDLVSPTKTGYTFGGWYALSDCSGTALTTLGAADYSADITLYAKWTANVYNISYYNNGGATFNGTHAANYPKTHTYGLITKLDSPKRDKYTFGGWYTASDCSGTAVTNLLATAYTDDITLYAKWTFSYVPGYSTGVNTAKKYIITYKDQNDKDFTGVLPATAPRSYAAGKATLLPKAIRSGFTFDGWFTDKACSGKAITSIAAIGYNSDITVYARWLEESYLLSYRDKGGSAFTGILPDGAPTEHGYSENTKLLPPTREGYIFSGWYENMDCTGQPITELAAESRTTDVLLYAKWTALDAGLTGVRVNGENARLAGSTLTVSLPEGSTLPTEPSAIEILAEGAVYTEPVTADNGATWTFSVTSPNGEKKDYTLKVDIQVPAQSLAQPDEEEEKKGLPLWPFLLGAGVLAAGGGLWYYFYRRKQYEY